MQGSLMRYPGGKGKLAHIIVEKLEDICDGRMLEYREPFFGGGGIGLEFLSRNRDIRQAWINDKDLGIANLWRSVAKYPALLKDEVMDFTPSVEHFDKFKKVLLNPHDGLDETLHGFMKLAMHQITYSGLGTKSGGPLGGRSQQSNYKIDCRWSPRHICKKIDKAHALLASRQVKYTSFDFEKVICENGNAIIYLDPPYYLKGNDLYQEGFTKDDHKRLADCLAKTSHQWVLSYDDCPEIRELYDGWASVTNINVTYSITATKNRETGERLSRKKSELLIWGSHGKNS